MTRSEQFARLLAAPLRQCAEQIYNQARSQYSQQSWLKVFYDHRYTGFTLSAVGGGGVLFADNTRSLNFMAPRATRNILAVDIAAIRSEFRDVAWFGITFIVRCDGASEILYDHDPKCSARQTIDHDSGVPF